MMLVLCVTFSFAQEAPYYALRINDDITLDGKLSESVWSLAPEMTDFMQTDPHPGDSALQKTEARVVYNDEYLYVGIRCYDDPNKLTRICLERDYSLGDDDGTGFLLDTYHDKNTGYCFCSNTLNARWDCQVLSDGNDNNDAFNTFWDVATAVDSVGYTTEYRVPWSSLRFESKDEVIMGIRIARLVRRTYELTTYPWMDAKTVNGWENVSYARDIVFEDIKSKRPIYIIPYAIANYSVQNILNADGTAYEKQSEFLVRKHFAGNEVFDKILSNIGADMKYGLSKNFTLDVTVNTDFAQAEVDDQIINLTKYAVNLPEKRGFFLESASNLTFTFPSGNELFTSRTIGNENGQIVPIVGGARVTGKTNGWQMGSLDMQTTGIDQSGISPHNFFVFSTRKDIDSIGSVVGGIITNRWNTDSTHTTNQTIGFSVLKRFDQNLSFFSGAASTINDFDLGGLYSGGYFNVGLTRNATHGFTFETWVDLVGKDCNPVMGYLDQANHGLGSVNLSYTWDLKDESKLEYFNLSTYNNYRWYLNSGAQETFESVAAPSMVFRSQASIEFSLYDYTIDSVSYDWFLDEKNAIAPGTYKMLYGWINLGAPLKSVYRANLSLTYGGYYGGRRFSITPDVSYSINKHIAIGVSYEYNHIAFDKFLQIDSTTLYQSSLFKLRLSYIFSTKVSVKIFTQYDNVSHLVSGNFRFRYNPHEGTDLYFIINQGLNTELDRFDPHLPRTDSREVTVKFVKTFGL
jgi:hypothetical protein